MTKSDQASQIKSLEGELVTLRSQTGGSINTGKIRHHKIRSLENQIEKLKNEKVEDPIEPEEETENNTV